jgi:hypothetical protein
MKTLGIRNVPENLKNLIKLESFYKCETIQDTVLRILTEYFNQEGKKDE